VEPLAAPREWPPVAEAAPEPSQPTAHDSRYLGLEEAVAHRSLQAPAQLYPEPVARKPPKRRDDVPLFIGSWTGTRNDWTGDVGISFVAEAKCTVTALGRSADVPLTETATVTLWLTETQEVLAAADVGPCSPVEGHYAFEAIGSGAGVELQAGMEYRLTQRCRSRMPDKWFDGRATAEEAAAWSASQYARFVGGVCRNGQGFPGREDGEHRRAGMVNFKVAQVCLNVRPVSRTELASTAAGIAFIEAGGDPAAIDGYVAVIAHVLALLVDELAALPGLEVLIVVAQDEALHKRVRLEPAEGEAELSRELAGSAEGVPACTVFDHRFASEVVSFAQRYNGEVDELGSPMDGAFVVSCRSGQVLAAAARIFRGHRLVGGTELVATLGGGVALSRSASGDVTALFAPEVRQGRALLMKPGALGQPASSAQPRQA